jgi:hypothetical protein
VVEPYDNDKKYPVFGFGGIATHMGETTVNHCFPLTGSWDNLEIHKFDGIVENYKNLLPKITLWGPTYFAPIIEK